MDESTINKWIHCILRAIFSFCAFSVLLLLFAWEYRSPHFEKALVDVWRWMFGGFAFSILYFVVELGAIYRMHGGAKVKEKWLDAVLHCVVIASLGVLLLLANFLIRVPSESHKALRAENGILAANVADLISTNRALIEGHALDLQRAIDSRPAEDVGIFTPQEKAWLIDHLGRISKLNIEVKVYSGDAHPIAAQVVDLFNKSGHQCRINFVQGSIQRGVLIRLRNREALNVMNFVGALNLGLMMPYRTEFLPEDSDVDLEISIGTKQ